jgi:hypothetical protein
MPRSSRLAACFQVSVRFAFVNHKAVLVSTHTKPQMASSFLVQSGMFVGSGLTHSRFFTTEKKRRNLSHIFMRVIKVVLFQTRRFLEGSFRCFRGG